MILRMLLLFLACFQFNSALEAGVWDNISGWFKGSEKNSPPNIRVLIAHDVDKLHLEVKGKYNVSDPYKNFYDDTRFAGKARYIQALSDGLKWGESFPDVHQLRIKPEDSQTVILVADKRYKGSIYIYDIGGTISAIDQLPIEEYLLSIMTNYDYLNLHPETWSALAIVARTNAYYQSANPKKDLWAVDAQKVNFNGFVPIKNPDSKRAVEATKYMIMSRTGVYERVSTPFIAQFGPIQPSSYKGMEISRISLEEADQMAREGEHAAQILAKAFPNTTIMLMQYSNP